jgi:hypothetical protein
VALKNQKGSVKITAALKAAHSGALTLAVFQEAVGATRGLIVEDRGPAQLALKRVAQAGAAAAAAEKLAVEGCNLGAWFRRSKDELCERYEPQRGELFGAIAVALQLADARMPLENRTGGLCLAALHVHLVLADVSDEVRRHLVSTLYDGGGRPRRSLRNLLHVRPSAQEALAAIRPPERPSFLGRFVGGFTRVPPHNTSRRSTAAGTAAAPEEAEEAPKQQGTVDQLAALLGTAPCRTALAGHVVLVHPGERARDLEGVLAKSGACTRVLPPDLIVDAIGSVVMDNHRWVSSALARRLDRGGDDGTQYAVAHIQHESGREQAVISATAMRQTLVATDPVPIDPVFAGRRADTTATLARADLIAHANPDYVELADALFQAALGDAASDQDRVEALVAHGAWCWHRGDAGRAEDLIRRGLAFGDPSEIALAIIPEPLRLRLPVLLAGLTAPATLPALAASRRQLIASGRSA